MRLSIFARLIISYLILFTMLAGVSLYFIYHLNHFNEELRSIILHDTLLLEYSSQLSDAMLSESSSDQKFVILKDEKLYKSYQRAQDEFNQLLGEALSKTNTEEIKQLFDTIGEQHHNFMALVNTERELIKSAKPYSVDLYAKQKKKIADDIIQKLKKIKHTSERNVFDTIVHLSERGDTAKNVSIMISIITLATCLVVAFIITRSIIKPLDLMRTKTVAISKGNFKGDLEVKSPPVIAELASAINIMCRKLQEVDAIKNDFFSYMSHELRTPLSSIKEATSMLLDGLGGEISEKQHRILSILIQECNRLIEMVNSLLDLSKMEAGMLKYQFVPMELSELIRKTLDALEPLAEAKSISIHNNIAASQLIKMDQERIQQVFRNLIGNAIKFTDKNGSIKLEANVRGNVVEVAVHDTGFGIPEEDLETIFLKYQQVVTAKRERVKGTGVGLATVKQIILAHGGKVWATSQVGQGSTFYITLPLAA